MEEIFKIKALQSCYLIYGEETYLRNEALKEIHKHSVSQDDLMNYSLFEGKEATAELIINACETMPFFAEYKLVVVKYGEFFKSGKKEETEKLTKFVKDIAPHTILVFIEKEVDKRNSLYKAIQKNYQVVEAAPQDYNQLQKFVQGYCQQNQLQMSVKIQQYFVNNMPQDINYILGELGKLQSFSIGQEVTVDMVDTVCIFALEQRVFTLVKKVISKDLIEALKIYYRLIEAKESPIMILALIARQYRILLQVKYLDKKGVPFGQIAKEVGIPSFVVKENIVQSKVFTFKQLQEILDLCLESDVEIKTGKMEAVKSIELLIMKCS